MQNLAVGIASSLASLIGLPAGLAVAVRPQVDALDRGLQLGELEVGMLRNAVVDLEPDGLARQLSRVLLRRRELALGRLLGIGRQTVRRVAQLVDSGPLGQKAGADLFGVHGRD